MERRKKKVICLMLSCFTLLLNISTVKAEAVPDVMNGSATIADCVMSYYAMAGAAVGNSTWIQSLYDGLGSSFGTIYDFAENGMLTINNDGTWQATTALTDAIENSSAYTSLGLDEVFNISSAEAAAGGGIAAASGAATLSGAVGGVASSGVLPVLGGVTAAYWGGIAIGTLCNHLIDKYKENIAKNANIMASQTALQNVPLGGRLLYGANLLSGTPQDIYYCCQSGIYGVGYLSNNVFNSYVFNADSESRNYILINRNNPNGRSYSVGQNAFNRVGGFSRGHSGWITMADEESCRSYAEGVRNGTIERPKNFSPDIIGENGNQEAETGNGGITVPNIKPMIDPGVQAGVPLTLSDWLNFANSVNSNNSQINPLPDNSALYDALIDRIVTPISNPNPDPDPNPNPDPYNPPVVTPVPDPDYDPVPDNPDQPDYESEKQNQTESVPDDPVTTGAPWTTDGLLDKFPFCIPKDMIDMVKQFSSGSRQAPYINWRFNPPNTPVDYTFNLDLSDFEDAATLIRMLELAAFIVGLAFATRYLIGAS